MRSGRKKLSLAHEALRSVPAVGRAFRIVDDQDARGAELLGFLVLVGPAAVIGHVLAVKDASGEIPRLVHFDEQDLAREVEALDVVPIPLRRLHEVAAVDELSSRFGRRILAFGPDDELVPKDRSEPDGRAADLE